MSTLEEIKESTIRRATGPTILLGDGSYFDYADPESSEITIDDYAFGLAYEGRFAGQCYSRKLRSRVYYSVAEHCTRFSYLVAAEHQYAALMHESGEPVCGDMVGPLKTLAPDYKLVEKRCEAAIQKRFGVRITDPELIKLGDIRMWETERQQLTRSDRDAWTSKVLVEPFNIEIIPWSPDRAAVNFIKRFYELAPAHILNQPFARSEYV